MQKALSLIYAMCQLVRWAFIGETSKGKSQLGIAIMPKKFKGENSKAAAARDRKQTAKQEAEDRKQRALEDAYWKDDDKHSQRKQDRRVSG